MSRDHNRKGFYNSREREREPRDRDRSWSRAEYRSRASIPGSGNRSPNRDVDKRHSRSPRKTVKDLDENILSEISKLPEPSELWENNQYQEGGFPAPPPPPDFQREGVSNTSYGTNYQSSYSGIYDEFPSLVSMAAAPHPPDVGSWNQMSLPPPPAPAPLTSFHNVEDQIKKEAAIESEMRHQKAALSKQREDYIKKAGILKKELDTLKDQRNELRGDAKRSPSPDTKRFLKENTKLQLEIQNKLKTINNVVDMLNGIIGEEAQEVHESEESPERGCKRKSRSPSSRKFNYVYYDPEMHWCRVCNEFPPTAKDYLNHLHSPAHHKMAAAHMEAPWHSVTGVNEGFASVASAPTKRTPIRGLQFFVPSTAWYCKLCDQFIGDLHCASAHLKSIVHSKNYTNFVEQNPHWETDWMSDRQKAFEKARATKGKIEEKPQYTAHTITFNKDGFHTKRKESPAPAPEEKKKKDKKKKPKRKKSSSSSSSSDSSSSDSEPAKKKKSKSKKEKRIIDLTDDKELSDWMSSIQTDRLNESDRKLLDSLKNRIKKDRSDNENRRSAEHASRDRERIAEMQRKIRESERREVRSRSQRLRSRSRSRSRGASRRRDERRRDRDDNAARPRSRPGSLTRESDVKKPEIRKMPFIGKMPVYKHLGKNPKNDEPKKEEQKKKEDDEMSKKRREEMDAEIQKKVAEFKEKIARAQLERQQALQLPPPAVALPSHLYLPPPAAHAPPAPYAPPAPHAPHAPAPPLPALPKDFQEALDIIFPSEGKSAELSQQELFAAMQPGLVGVVPPFPPLGLMQPQMFGFDLNASLFGPRPQLYDAHVPIVPGPNIHPQKNNPPKIRLNKYTERRKSEQNGNRLAQTEPPEKPMGIPNARNKEELDDLAMLGIDESDVGAGM